MSWIDTVVLTLILWSGVKGYLRGLRRAVLQLLCLLCAALASGLYHQPLMVYLREEWHAEALLVAALGQKDQGLVAAMRPVAGIPAAPVPEDHLATVVLSAGAALLFFCLLRLSSRFCCKSALARGWSGNCRKSKKWLDFSWESCRELSWPSCLALLLTFYCWSSPLPHWCRTSPYPTCAS